MEVQHIVLKPGSVLLDKNYGSIKKFWYKLIGKELPYNNFYLLSENTDFLRVSESGELFPYNIFQPKKDYNKKEINLLKHLIDSNRTDLDKNIPYVSGFDMSNKDLFTIINAIRPNTFAEGETNLNKLISSKYYLMYLSDEEIDWSKYISGTEY